MSEFYYGVYDLEDNEVCVGIFDKANEVAEYLGVKHASVNTAIYRYGGRVLRRYRVEKVLKEEENEI